MDERRWVETLREIKGWLDDAGVKYWLDYGTLLGAVRDGKFIPWDADIDIGTMCTEADKIIRTIPEIERRGFKIDMIDTAIFLFRNSILISIGLNKLGGENAWILTHETSPKFNNNIIVLYFSMLADRLPYRNLTNRRPLNEKIAFTLIPSFADRTLRKFLFRMYEWLGGEYRVFVVPKSYYENLDSISFYDMTFNIPSHVEDYLSLRYGENWRNPDPNWAYDSKDRNLDCKFDFGKREDLSIFECLK